MDLYKVELVPEARFSKVPKSIRKFFTPGKPEQNLKPYEYRAVLFAYS